MLTFHNMLRPEPAPRRAMFDRGLRAAGLRPESEAKCDVLLIWSRYGRFSATARLVEARGGRVLVAENATWGNEFAGQQWYSLWLGFHNVVKGIRPGGADRWAALGVDLRPWRTSGTETVGLAQRGIGPAGIASPRDLKLPCDRVRPHPGIRPAKPLEDDLRKAREVVTWGSGAAVKALIWGIPVRSLLPDWAAEQDNTDAGRLAMLERLAWAQWRHEEIESGDAFRWLLCAP